MNRHLPLKALIALLFSFCPLGAEPSKIESEYYQKLDALRAEYRHALAAEISKADKVKISMFDGALAGSADPFAEAPKPTPGLPAPIALDDDDRKILTALIAKQMTDPEETQMAMCHHPVHVVTVFREGKVIFKSTLCWGCTNFSFDYPDGSEYLPTSKAMKRMFMKHLPVSDNE
jgi:hypothetical protein